MQISSNLQVCILTLVVVVVGCVPAALAYHALSRRYGTRVTKGLQAILLLGVGVPVSLIALIRAAAAVLMVNVDRWGSMNYTMACMLWSGTPIYSPQDGPQLICTVYGPLFYTLLAPVAIGPLAGNIAAARLYEALPLIASGLLIYRLTAPGFGRVAGLVAGIALPVFILYPTPLLHPDTWVLLVGALSAIIFYRLMREADLPADAQSPNIGLSLAAGLLAAMAIYLKLTAIVLLAPVGALLVTHFRWRPVAIAVVTFAFGLSIPWWPGMPFQMQNHVDHLRLTANHPLVLDSAWNIAFLAFWLLFPMGLLILYLRSTSRDAILRGDLRSRKLTLTAFVSAWAVMLLLSFKDGADAYYMIPLVPTLIAYARRISAASAPAEAAVDPTKAIPLPFRIGTAALSIALVVFLIGEVLRTYTVYGVLARIAHSEQFPTIGDELDTLVKKYGDQTMQLGYGKPASSWIFEGWQAKMTISANPPLMGLGTVDDRDRAGFSFPQATLDAIARGDIQIWLIPNLGDPFTVRSNYHTYAELFTPAFRELFFRHYERIEQSKNFDIYRYRQIAATEIPADESGESSP